MVRLNYIKVILHMVRPVNLAIIILAQVFVRYFLILPLLRDSGSHLVLPLTGFILLTLATTLVAAGGYIINDILDTGIDKVNKPHRVSLHNIIPGETREYIYYGVNVLGIAAGAGVSLMVHKVELTILFIIIATMLYYYSLKYKYLPFWGNFTISLLSSLTILIVWLFEFFAFRATPGEFVEAFPSFNKITVITIFYALFAFLISLLREITKDLEDQDGDAKNGCRTLPVAFGEPLTRKILIIMHILVLLLLFSFQYMAFHYLYPVVGFYLSIPGALLILALYRCSRAKDKNAWRNAGNILKAVMISGILSMLFISFRSLS